MTREQAYERLDLPAGTALQQVRRKVHQMHNDFQMRVDNAPTPKLRQASSHATSTDRKRPPACTSASARPPPRS